jgi:phage terminase large subunit-like protein
MLKLPPAALEDVLTFAEAFGVQLYDWQREAFGAACRRDGGHFRYRLAGVSVPRGNGKSYAGALVGLWRLLCGPAPQDIISAALDLDGAKVVLDHARRIVRGHRGLAGTIEVQASGLSVPATGSRWTIVSREHTASRGRHATLIVYDEIGWAKDEELFSSLLAGQASVDDPLCLVISTVGRRQSGPLWTVKMLADGGDETVCWWHSSENLSPKVTPRFLERQRRILLPAQFAREHQNSWVDAADSFAGAAEVDAAMAHGWTEQIGGQTGVPYVGFVDLGAVHDPTVIAIGHAEGTIGYIDVIRTFQGSRERPVDLSTVEATLRDFAGRFRLRRIRIESWQGLGAVQSLQRAGLPVELFTPTAKTNAEEWPVLAQRLAARTLVLPPHVRLREELLNLVYEVGPTGIKVIDKGKVHQDHAVAVRGVVAMLLDQPSREGPMASNLAARAYRPTDWGHLDRFSGIETPRGAIRREFGRERD